MDPAAVQDAGRQLKADGSVQVPYTCQLSGKEEAIVLVGDGLANRLAEVLTEIDGSGDAKILAGLSSAELCECDVATLTSLPEDDVVNCLRQLTSSGVLAHRELHGMQYYRLASEQVRTVIQSTIHSIRE